jgi:hypothetical protein
MAWVYQSYADYRKPRADTLYLSFANVGAPRDGVANPTLGVYTISSARFAQIPIHLNRAPSTPVV